MQRRLGPNKVGIFGLLQASKVGASYIYDVLNKKFDYMLIQSITLSNSISLLAGKKNSLTIIRLTYN